ncbi:heterokaryon incompatibility protein-domain-containing protein [Podospora conica]|nr:heterokaryon incompatibility protein-domain-containing protein [Schizothecium conicum]
MRLIEAKTLVVKEFFTDIPPYAILSHTWGNGEVTFQDMQDLEVASKLQGFRKIRGCADLAIANGHDWIWVDTCCIDKTSSAELSEAINSMFAWYRDSAVCYVYLGDVHDITDAMLCDFYTGGPKKLYVRNLIVSSRWFKRGWTLQELVAPYHVEFFTAEWKSLGMKNTLEVLLSEKTGIPRAALAGGPLSEYSAAEKMSWASQRVTTREEDAAYCLLGIFDVHMPLLYGESTSAFLRLQEEIFRRTEDLSLLVWTDARQQPFERRSILARHPSAFGAPVLTEAFLDTGTSGPARTPRWMFPVQRDKLAPLQLERLQSLHSPPVMTNRGLLATIWLSPFFPPRTTGPTIPLDPSPLDATKGCFQLFAWALSTATLQISDQKMNRHQAPCLIAITLDTEIELATETGEDGEARTLPLRETLLRDSRPFVAWRSRTQDLMCIETSESVISSLVPRQVYLSTKEHQHRRPRISTLDQTWFRNHDDRVIRVQSTSAPGAPHILHRAPHFRRSSNDTAATNSWVALKDTLILPATWTDLYTVDLKVTCQKQVWAELAGAAPATHETRVALELGLVPVAYHPGVERLRCALVAGPAVPAAAAAADPSSTEAEHHDRSYMALGCGHVMCATVKAVKTEGLGLDTSRWNVMARLDISIS